MEVQAWTENTFNSFRGLWSGFIAFLPSFIGALIIIIIGLIVAWALRTIVERLFGYLKLDSLLKKAGLGTILERGGLQVNTGKFFGFLVYWFIVIFFTLAATDTLGLFGVSLFLRDVVAYLPNIIVAVLIMLAAVLLAGFLKSIVKASVSGARIHGSKFLGSFVWWTVMIFGFLTTLMQLGIATAIVNTLITGLIAMIVIAGGISFGLGGKDYAAHLMEKVRKEIEEK
jgi:hypothetical protein